MGEMKETECAAEQVSEREKVKSAIIKAFDFLMQHDGAGKMEVSIKLLKRGQKEVLIQCGRTYRYVLDAEE